MKACLPLTPLEATANVGGTPLGQIVAAVQPMQCSVAIHPINIVTKIMARDVQGLEKITSRPPCPPWGFPALGTVQTPGAPGASQGTTSVGKT